MIEHSNELEGSDRIKPSKRIVVSISKYVLVTAMPTTFEARVVIFILEIAPSHVVIIFGLLIVN